MQALEQPRIHRDAVGERQLDERNRRLADELVVVRRLLDVDAVFEEVRQQVLGEQLAAEVTQVIGVVELGEQYADREDRRELERAVVADALEVARDVERLLPHPRDPALEQVVADDPAPRDVAQERQRRDPALEALRLDLRVAQRDEARAHLVEPRRQQGGEPAQVGGVAGDRRRVDEVGEEVVLVPGDLPFLVAARVLPPREAGAERVLLADQAEAPVEHAPGVGEVLGSERRERRVRHVVAGEQALRVARAGGDRGAHATTAVASVRALCAAAAAKPVARSATLRRMLKRSCIASSAAAASRSRSGPEASRRPSAWARAPGSRWPTSRPLTPSSIISGTPATVVETAGVPSAIVSSRTVGRPSRSPSAPMTHGSANAVAEPISASTSSCASAGTSSTLSCRPARAICASSRSRSGPSPTITVRSAVPRPARSRVASTRSAKPFFSMSRPTATTRPGVRGPAAGRRRSRSRPL